MNLRKRARSFVDFILTEIPPVAVDREDYRLRCINTLTKNLQHVQRGVVEDVLKILREERTKNLGVMNGTMTLAIDKIIREVSQL
ncbi:MAG: hypothetical protein KAR39_07420 [Thermoplasmata archaeon]|nr:hypothetical protein [Thermoplasmata archaeon]